MPPAVHRPPPWRRLLAIPTPLLFGVAVAIALFLLWRQGTLADLGAAARRLEPGLLVGILGLYLLGLALLCLRWQALVRMAGGRADVPLAAEAFLTSVVVNYAAPVGLAVPTRAALSARDLGLGAAAGGAVALWEVALDGLVLGLVSLGWLATADRAVLPAIDIGSAGLRVAVVGGLLVLALIAGIGFARPRLRRRMGLAAGELVRYPGRRPAAAGIALGVTLAYWALQAVILRLLLGAVGVGSGPEPGLVLGLLGPPILVGMFSPVPGGAGIREGLMVGVARLWGVDGGAVLLAAVAYRVALFVAIPPLYAGARLWRAVRPVRAR